jgi:hypothetical protein
MTDSRTDSRQLMAQAARLRFGAPLEEQFQDAYFNQSLILSRAALAALMLMWAAFGFLDIYALPLSLHTVWVIRYAVVFPLWLVVLGWSFYPSFRRFMQPSMSLLVFAGGSAIVPRNWGICCIIRD